MAVTTMPVVSTRCEVLMKSPMSKESEEDLRKVRENELDGALGRGARAGRDDPDCVEVEQDRAARGELVVLHRAAEGDLGVVGGAAALLPELAGNLAAARVRNRDRDELLALLGGHRVVGSTERRARAERAATGGAARVDLGGAAAAVGQGHGAGVLDELLDLLLGRSLSTQCGAENHHANQRAADQAHARFLVQHGTSPRVRLGSNDSTPLR